MIVEYKLDVGPRGMVAPAWVKDGGYFMDPDNFTLVGWTLDPPREFKVPDSVLVLDKAGLVERVLDIHARYPAKKRDGGEVVDLTTQEMTAIASDWYDSKNA